ncbi:hypothetical protein GCM10008986_14290 [Salinibacillus aidingensis]|uniref:Uncharacterized protein n=1 Tax=Salinibacillus aidingensis TaxID=237684 RepID=A0ABN1B5H9_9BACI
MGFLKSKKFLVIGIVLFSLIGFIFYFFYGTPWDLISYKDKFETYLEERYHQDFVIDEISYDFLHGGTYHAYAFSETNPEVTFHVGQNSKSAEIDDAYHYELWRYQARNEVTPIIEKTFPDRLNHAVEVRDSLYPDATQKSEVPNYKNMVTLEIGIAKDHTKITENKEAELEKAFKLIEELNEKDLNMDHFSISYKSKTLQLSGTEMKSIKKHNDFRKMVKGL